MQTYYYFAGITKYCVVQGQSFFNTFFFLPQIIFIDFEDLMLKNNKDYSQIFYLKKYSSFFFHKINMVLFFYY